MPGWGKDGVVMLLDAGGGMLDAGYEIRENSLNSCYYVLIKK